MTSQRRESLQFLHPSNHYDTLLNRRNSLIPVPVMDFSFYPTNFDSLDFIKVEEPLMPPAAFSTEMDVPPLIPCAPVHQVSLHDDSESGSLSSDDKSVPSLVSEHVVTAPAPVRSIPSNVVSRTPASVSPQPPILDQEDPHRFKPFHEEKWSLRYKELLDFHRENGHAAVPHTHPKNPQLARWVKRQRRQYKLRQEGRPSTMTTERLDLLNEVGFVWDSHDVNWREKLAALERFKRTHGNCNVPSNHKDKKLATWVKCQRRQYKLYWDGKPSAMNPGRILELEKVGFEWEIRTNVNRNAKADDYKLLYETIKDL